MFEVEQKFPLKRLEETRERLISLGGEMAAAIEQIDGYYRHPARDFAKTDEALRIRRLGERNFVTYKGPKIDATTKTRREIELPLPSGITGAAQFAELVEDQSNAIPDALIGVESHDPGGIAEVPRRQVLHQFAPPGLREPAGVHPHADAMKLRLG